MPSLFELLQVSVLSRISGVLMRYGRESMKQPGNQDTMHEWIVKKS
jgi:hypothetical protein